MIAVFPFERRGKYKAKAAAAANRRRKKEWTVAVEGDITACTRSQHFFFCFAFHTREPTRSLLAVVVVPKYKLSVSKVNLKHVMHVNNLSKVWDLNWDLIKLDVTLEQWSILL